MPGEWGVDVTRGYPCRCQARIQPKKTGRVSGPFFVLGKRVAYFSLASARSASALSVFSHENVV